MQPTIGRIVIYTYTAEEVHPNDATECPAVIVRVWSETSVNLKLLEDTEENSWKTSVELGGPGEPGKWAWPVMNK
jgi:hypothetical protein